MWGQTVKGEKGRETEERVWEGIEERREGEGDKRKGGEKERKKREKGREKGEKRKDSEGHPLFAPSYMDHLNRFELQFALLEK